MITSIDMAGVKFTIDESTKQYIMQKIGRLDRYLPRHARKSVTADVKLKLVNQANGDKYEAEIMLNVPDKVLTAKNSATNAFASIDLAESKILSQLHKYKEATILHVGRRRLFSKR